MGVNALVVVALDVRLGIPALPLMVGHVVPEVRQRLDLAQRTRKMRAFSLSSRTTTRTLVLIQRRHQLTVYRGPAELPAEFGGANACGAIVLWTRRGS